QDLSRRSGAASGRADRRRLPRPHADRRDPGADGYRVHGTVGADARRGGAPSALAHHPAAGHSSTLWRAGAASAGAPLRRLTESRASSREGYQDATRGPSPGAAYISKEKTMRAERIALIVLSVVAVGF